MPKLCTICTSQYREQIDIEIVNGTSIRVIASRFSLSRSAVGRHRVTCHKAIIASTLEDSRAAELLEAAKEAEGVDVGVTSLSRAAEMFRKCRKASNEAFKRGDTKTALLAAKEARGYLELMAKLNGEFSNSESAEKRYAPMFVFAKPLNIDFGGGPAMLPDGKQTDQIDVTPERIEATALPESEREEDQRQ
jgi:hypothetical protein